LGPTGDGHGHGKPKDPEDRGDPGPGWQHHDRGSSLNDVRYGNTVPDSRAGCRPAHRSTAADGMIIVQDLLGDSMIDDLTQATRFE
jgi:hypothetical protein